MDTFKDVIHEFLQLGKNSYSAEVFYKICCKTVVQTIDFYDRVDSVKLLAVGLKVDPFQILVATREKELQCGGALKESTLHLW